jgi:hypothetical protein
MFSSRHQEFGRLEFKIENNGAINKPVIFAIATVCLDPVGCPLKRDTRNKTAMNKIPISSELPECIGRRSFPPV